MLELEVQDLAKNKNENIPDYVKKAIIMFNEIMSKKKDIMECINRANKGELAMLHYLSLNDAPSLPSELSTELNSSAARISAMLGSLEKKRLIKRDIDESNRRNIHVTITEAGRELAKIEITEIEKSLAHVFKKMGETDTVNYLKLFDKFLLILHEYINENV